MTDSERARVLEVVKKSKGSSQKVRRASILLKADADGPNWKDQDIADANFCTRQCVENVRKKLVTEGFEIALCGKKRETPPRQKLLDGEQEAKVIALRLSDPPEGHNGWTLRLLSEEVVELEIAPNVSHVTMQRTLKKGSAVQAIELPLVVMNPLTMFAGIYSLACTSGPTCSRWSAAESASVWRNKQA